MAQSERLSEEGNRRKQRWVAATKRMFPDLMDGLPLTPDYCYSEEHVGRLTSLVPRVVTDTQQREVQSQEATASPSTSIGQRQPGMSPEKVPYEQWSLQMRWAPIVCHYFAMEQLLERAEGVRVVNYMDFHFMVLVLFFARQCVNMTLEVIDSFFVGREDEALDKQMSDSVKVCRILLLEYTEDLRTFGMGLKYWQENLKKSKKKQK